MTRDDIIRMAREANINVTETNTFADDMYISVLYRFANLVAAHEREQFDAAREDLRAALAEPEVEQEPVAVVFDAYDAHGLQWLCQHPLKRGDKLYAAPSRREWVGLTDEEINAAWKSCDPQRLLPSFAAAIEAALKEKNRD